MVADVLVMAVVVVVVVNVIQERNCSDSSSIEIGWINISSTTVVIKTYIVNALRWDVRFNVQLSNLASTS